MENERDNERDPELISTHAYKTFDIERVCNHLVVEAEYMDQSDSEAMMAIAITLRAVAEALRKGWSYQALPPVPEQSCSGASAEE